MGPLRRFVTSVPLWGAALAALAAVIAYGLGDSYTGRVSDHRGYYLVPVDDRVAATDYQRPRHTAIIVIDGLRRDAAETMTLVARLRAAGQCRVMDMRPLTISRPIFAVLSTGLEVDRTGARHNVDTSALAAESIWQVARREGLKVTATGNLSWWQELFPDGFDRYIVQPGRQLDVSQEPAMADLMLVYAGYVDDEAHDHGAASQQYRDAVVQVDAELAEFMARLDLEQDAVVVTTDHGHMPQGGHGGTQAEIAEVLTCYAGRGVRRDSTLGRMSVTTLAPSVAVLLGMRFPRHMRAGDDDLDTIADIVAGDTLGLAYWRDRQAAVDRYRAKNRAQLAEWLGEDEDGNATWTALYRRERRSRLLGVAVAIAIMGAGWLLLVRRRRLGWVRALGLFAWMAATVAVTCLAYAAFRGSFDFTSINQRGSFVRASIAISLAGAAVATLAHVALWRDAGGYLEDQLTLVATALALSLAHPVVYGMPLGFPLPGRMVFFLPLFAAAFVLSHALWALGACAVIAWRDKRKGRASPNRSPQI